MANSITLSQSLVDDIAQKITDGTATAEQVVLYTKGLNQLQTGNDFQSVVIGLSQSAVDAIDSANAQFQEDAQNALDTFAQTATNIDTSAANAVSAINTAKDTLVATDAEISTTISNLPAKSSIEESITFLTEQDKYSNNSDAPNWDGPHPLPKNFKPHNPAYPERVIDHPWKAAAFLRVNRRGYSNYDSTVSLFDHEMRKMDEVGVHNSDILYTTAAQTNIQDQLMPTARYQYWEMVHNYGIFSTEETASTSDRNNPGVTGYMDHYGIGRHVFNPKAWAGLHPGNFLLSSNYTGSSDRVTYGGSITTIVGTSKRDFIMSRPYNTNQFYMHATYPGNFATYSRNIRPNRRNETDYWTTNRAHETFQDWGKYDMRSGSDNNYPGDIQYHDRIRFTDYHSSGYGLTAYNANTNKFAYIATEAGGTSYNWNPKLYTVNQGKDLRDICLGRVEVSAVDANPTAEGIMTLEIDSALDFKTESQVDKTVANYSTYDRYHGKVVLCDNDTMIISTPYDHSHTPKGVAIRRIVKNATGDDYQYDTMQWWDGNTSYTSADYGGGIVSVTNDGKYAAMFHSYYYYGAGMMGALIRVSDGAMLPFQNQDTTRGFNAIPIKHNKFIFSRQYTGSSDSNYLVDCEYLFAKHTDMTNVTGDIFGGSDHQEYDYHKYDFESFARQNYTSSGTSIPIYNPYTYLFEYFNADGTRKDIYDRNLNLITP